MTIQTLQAAHDRSARAELSDRTRFESADGQRWASLCFPRNDRPYYRVFRHANPAGSGTVVYASQLSDALDALQDRIVS